MRLCESHHWGVVLIDNRSEVIGYYELISRRKWRCLKKIRTYLQHEHSTKRETKSHRCSIFFVKKHLAQQENQLDCGVFICMFTKKICQDIEAMNFTQRDIPQQVRLIMIDEIIAGQISERLLLCELTLYTLHSLLNCFYRC